MHGATIKITRIYCIILSVEHNSRNITTCFGPICGPSSGCDLTFQGPLYKKCGVFFGVLGVVRGREGGQDLVVPIEGTMTWGY